MDMNNYNLGLYVGMAVNVSSKHPYPTEPMLAKQDKPKVMTDQEMAAMARKNTRKLGGKIQHGNKNRRTTSIN